MADTFESFVSNLTDSGLMSEAEVSEICQQLSSAKKTDRLATLVQRLVNAGHLTEYQAHALQQGKTTLLLGDYTILDVLGVGGMGEVYLAQHQRMKRKVALKVLPVRTLGTGEHIKRFQREIETAAQLDHPNIVTAHDAGELQGIHYLVMQYIDGKDLSSVSHQVGRLPIADTLNFMLQAACGLEYAHGRGILHRDIKPSNLLLDSKGTIKILDMGLARIVESVEDDSLTSSGQMMGTADYMAPEQAEDAHSADHRADIYSLGCTIYRLLAGKAMYPTKTKFTKILAHRDWPIPALRDERPEVPPRLEVIYQKMVQKRPEDRYQSMTEVIQDLRELAGEIFEDPLDGSAADPHGATISYAKYLDLDHPEPASLAHNETFSQQSAQSLHDTIGDRSSSFISNPRTKWLVAIRAGLLAIVALVYALAVLSEETPVAKPPEAEPEQPPGDANPPDRPAKPPQPIEAKPEEPDDPVGPSSQPLREDAQRAAARWVIEAGGSFHDGANEIRDVALIPESDFRIVRVLVAGADINDNDLLILKNLNHLTLLDLSDTRITAEGLRLLEGLSSLRDLRLYEAKLLDDDGAAAISRFSNVYTLDVRGSRITNEGVRHLTKLSPLTDLKLAGVQQKSPITLEGVVEMKDLQQLASLDLSRSMVSDEGLQNLNDLEKLTWLDLSQTNITDSGLEHLSGIAQLIRLRLGGNVLSDAAVQRLSDSLPDCTITYTSDGADTTIGPK